MNSRNTRAMTRLSTLALVTCGALAGAAPGHAATPARPNIVVMIADDLGWGDVGFHKGSIPTPQLDKLAREGVELQRFYVCPVCSPTRAGLLTGQMPRRLGITDVMGPGQNLPTGVVTLPGTLRGAGYATALVGKWHLGNTGTPLRHGFDHFYGFLGPQIDYFAHTNQRDAADWWRDAEPVREEGYSTTLFADDAVRRIRERDKTKPLYLQVAFNAVHIPRGAPASLLAKYKSLGESAATYAAVTDAMDEAVGRILGAIDEAGIRDNTIVVFFSDNGAGGAGRGGAGGTNAPLRGGKSTVYEGGVRTVCVMRAPTRLKPGGVSRQPVAVHDLFPTLAEAAGVAVPEKLDGRSQWAALTGGVTRPREPLVVAMADCAIVDGDWKLIETAAGVHELYQLADDPSEKNNLAAAKPDIVKRLEAALGAVKRDLPAASAARPKPGAGKRGRGA